MSLRSLLALVLAAASFGTVPTAAAADPRPNIIVIQTDDQSLNTMSVMTRTRALLGDAGMTFQNYYTTFSLCCPSRASLLTGQYSHNHGVVQNDPPNGSYYALDSGRTLPVWLRQAGYTTAHVGKYLNAYVLGVPPGWTEWYTGSDPTTYRYFNYILSENGIPHLYGSRDRDYSTDVFTRKAVDFIKRRAPRDQPFFLSLDYFGPHRASGITPGILPSKPATPAPRHAGTLAGTTLPVDPSTNETDVSDKPAHVRDKPTLTAEQLETLRSDHQARLEALLSVDEGVEQVIQALEESGELANTMIFFISDNGWMDGQHRYDGGKRRVYEPSVHLPLLVRGPGVPAGSTTAALAANIDLAPTIAELAQATPNLVIDGRSLLPVFSAPATSWDRDILIEYVQSEQDPDPGFTAVRDDEGRVYVEHENGERELYDLGSDPFQLNSLHATSAWDAVRAALSARLAALRTCAGVSCQ